MTERPLHFLPSPPSFKGACSTTIFCPEPDSPISPMKKYPARFSVRHVPGFLCLIAFLPFLTILHAADDKLMAAVRAADDERIAATRAADRARLAAVYSDDLHYGHSNGKVDNKTSQIQGITTGGNKYERFEHKDRNFRQAAPGIVVMTGRVLIHMSNTQSGEKITNDLNYLAVWREEKGKWRFLAWQSCKNPPADTKK
jgi:ketosteroid isomerase-like protein